MKDYEKSSSAEHRGTEFGVALRSIKRHKRTPAYRAQLQREIRRAELDAATALTPMEQRKARLLALECSMELSHLDNGGTPDAFHGLIRFPMPDEEMRQVASIG